MNSWLRHCRKSFLVRPGNKKPKIKRRATNCNSARMNDPTENLIEGKRFGGPREIGRLWRNYQPASRQPQISHLIDRLCCLCKVSQRGREDEEVAFGEQVCDVIHII